MSWLYKKGVDDFDKMSDLSKDARQKLKDNASISSLFFLAKKDSGERGTMKYLFQTYEGRKIETVLISKSNRATVCLSTQIGCPIKCSFCASGSVKFVRNLEVDEIISQLLYFVKEGIEITNVVFMGMGEPLLNYSNLLKAIRLMNSKDGMNIGIRRITVSTCGLPKEIRKLAGEGLEFNLSISLNAPTDRTRSTLMKINTKHPIKELLKAVEYYLQNTNRRVTFEYVMIKGVNDTIKDAKELASLLKGMLCHVNLIPFNKVENCRFESTSRERLLLFSQILAHHGVNATIRKSSGADVNGACGQLAAR